MKRKKTKKKKTKMVGKQIFVGKVSAMGRDRIGQIRNREGDETRSDSFNGYSIT